MICINTCKTIIAEPPFARLVSNKSAIKKAIKPIPIEGKITHFKKIINKAPPVPLKSKFCPLLDDNVDKQP